MDEKLVAAIILAITTLPELAIGLACVSRRWMPAQFAKHNNAKVMQSIFGIGLLLAGFLMLLLACIVALTTKVTLVWLAPLVVVVITIVILVMSFLIVRESKKLS